MSLILSVGIVLLVTALVTVTTRDKTVRMVMVVPIYGIAISGGIIAAEGYTRLQEQRARDACISTVTRSDGNREQHLTIYDVLDRELNDSRIGDELRAALDENLPDRSTEEC